MPEVKGARTIPLCSRCLQVINVKELEEAKSHGSMYRHSCGRILVHMNLCPCDQCMKTSSQWRSVP